jgi:sulfur-oxidizing protein SoxB
MIDAETAGRRCDDGHWEFTHGAARVKEVIEGDFAGKIDFVAQNAGPPISAILNMHVLRAINGVGRHHRPGLSVHANRQSATSCRNGRSASGRGNAKVVADARAKGAQVVVLLSHNGMDVDLKMASRVTGIDAILGGHTHDGVWRPTLVANRGGKTIVATPGAAASSWPPRFRRQGRQGRGLSYRLCPRSARCCRRILRWPS